jgi:uncharacterized membrane protein YfcA
MPSMSWHLVVGFAFGLAIAALTAPVGVSGAVFLLPVQVSVLGVPSPAVTPTNLLYNVIAVPGALLRYRKAAELWTGLTRSLLGGTIPGVVLGAVVRVYVLPNGAVFKALIAVFLLPLGSWLLLRERLPRLGAGRRFTPASVSVLGFGAGLVGGVYGIGGGSLLAPILAASGYSVIEVAPAALMSTFVTSCVGAAAYAVLAVAGHHSAGPRWLLGLACGLGGLVGGYLGASLQPRMPPGLLRLLLGWVAVALSIAYVVQVI